MKSIATLSLLVFALVFTSCDETKRVIDVAGNVQLSGDYTVTNVEGTSMSATKPTITFAALSSRVSGNAGCNNYFGDYTITNNTLTLGELAATKKMCGEDAMQVEDMFLETMNKVGGYRIQDNVLTLYAKSDQSVLITATKDKEEN